MKLVLVRHCETVWNEQRRVQGAGSDIELSALGRSQVQKLARFLSSYAPTAIVSSPLKRALVTAQAVAAAHGLTVEVREGLREIDVGHLEGVELSSLNTSFSRLLMELWQGGSERLPGGESFTELQERSWSAVEPLLAQDADDTLIVISHYFVTLAILFRALDLPIDYLTRFKIDLGSITTIEFRNEGSRLVGLNETCYLRA